jgi:chemotaxis protein methyltransferase CheR
MNNKGIALMQNYILDQCGIKIGEEKIYLIESRLSRLLIESGCSSFDEFYCMVSKQKDRELSEKIIDAITTNETMWFRDKSPWNVIEDVLLPFFIEELRLKKRSSVKIWSAACSTGQEPYSTAICIDRYLSRQGVHDVFPSSFEIFATDISNTVLEIARMGKYDGISITRGLDSSYRDMYFHNKGRVWNLSENIRDKVQFKKFNLQDSFISLGKFDIIFCRNVMIYFCRSLQNEVLEKIASALNPGGILFLGSSEIFPEYKNYFELVQHKSGVYYRVKG